MCPIVTLKVEVGFPREKVEDFMASLRKASDASEVLQSALEEISKALLDGGLVIQELPDPGKVVNLTRLPASASDDLALLDGVKPSPALLPAFASDNQDQRMVAGRDILQA